MVKVSRLSAGYRWGLAAAAATVAALFSPHLITYLHGKFMAGTGATRLAQSIVPQRPVERVITGIDTNDLLSRLENGDAQWQPQEELLPDGSTRFLYKRRSGEPDLSVSELRSLINDPPTFFTEREAILHLLETLRQAGVRVILAPTINKGAAAEWDHREGLMRIQPYVTDKGSIDFLRVLNHEAIHVAQSCRSGYLLARPSPLGISVPKVDQTMRRSLNNPVYTNASHHEKVLELEAYSLQNNSNLARSMVSKECKLSPTSKLSHG
ncbi:MAG: hypothetical protein VKO39_14270 [Cyanobacteriota bacterium]|nr:hypothetical protein [Cyanobacteriota bacterium]